MLVPAKASSPSAGLSEFLCHEFCRAMLCSSDYFLIVLVQFDAVSCRPKVSRQSLLQSGAVPNCLFVFLCSYKIVDIRCAVSCSREVSPSVGTVLIIVRSQNIDTQ